MEGERFLGEVMDRFGWLVDWVLGAWLRIGG